MATYTKYFFEELKHMKPFTVTVKTDEETITTNVFMSAICNSRKYGTGVPLNVVGNPMDGKFEIVLNEEINLSSLLKAGLSSFDEKYFDNQSSRVLMTSKAELVYDEPRLLQLDGEVTCETLTNKKRASHLRDSLFNFFINQNPRFGEKKITSLQSSSPC